MSPTSMLVLLLACVAVAVSATAGTTATDRTLRLQRGAALAEARCSVCHAVGATGASPARANLDTPFHRLHERYPIPMLAEAAKTGHISGHDEMPGFDFAMDEIEALLAYIDSLAPGKPGYLAKGR